MSGLPENALEAFPEGATVGYEQVRIRVRVIRVRGRVGLPRGRDRGLRAG